MLGVVDGVLADRAFVAERQTAAAELGTVADLVAAAPHNVANALAAAALARSIGVPPVAVRDGTSCLPAGSAPHRDRRHGRRDLLRRRLEGDEPARCAGVPGAFDDVVWIAGGLAKGAQFDALVTAVATGCAAWC